MLQFHNSTTKAKITTDMLQNYYTHHFDNTALINLIGLSTFSNREFGFQFENNSFVRNRSFTTPRKLQKFMQKGVSQAYVGAVFKQPPSRSQTIKHLSWKFRELVFDIDINDYDPIRNCCQGNNFCNSCWTLIKDAMTFLDATLKEDFGFTKTQWIFSGRRGVHCWVHDELGKTLDRKQRSAIINYLTLIKSNNGEADIDNPLQQIKYTKTLSERIFTLLATSYLRYATPEELRTLGLTKSEIATFKGYAHRGYLNFNPPHLLYQIFPSCDKNRLIKEIIIKRYPRIDQKVTTDLTRLLKIPNSVATTGKICVVIDKPSKFDPFAAPSIYDFV